MQIQKQNLFARDLFVLITGLVWFCPICKHENSKKSKGFKHLFALKCHITNEHKIIRNPMISQKEALDLVDYAEKLIHFGMITR